MSKSLFLTVVLLYACGVCVCLCVCAQVDPSTLGGLMITLENRSIDLSASSRLMEVTQDFQ